jgi:hypothetical protein
VLDIVLGQLHLHRLPLHPQEILGLLHEVQHLIERAILRQQ